MKMTMMTRNMTMTMMNSSNKPLKHYRLDMDSYEKFKAASYDDVNKLLTNVYSQGFYDADKPYLKEEGGDSDIFTQKHADIVCQALDDNKIKGIGVQTLKKLKDLVNSLVVV